MGTDLWRRRRVMDMLFGIDGSGWYEPELRDSIGYRWSGPGRFSVLRGPPLPGAGQGRAQLLILPNETVPEVAIFLNGWRLEVVPRRLGPLAMLDFAWPEAAMAGAPGAEFWFHTTQLLHLPAAGNRMRSVGFRLSTLTLESAPGAEPLDREGLALMLGRRFLAERLPVAMGSPVVALRSLGDERRMEMHLTGARLGPSALPQLQVALRASGEGMEIALAPPGKAPWVVVLDGGSLSLPKAATARDTLLLCRFCTALREGFGRWLDVAMKGAAPDAELLAAWQVALDRLARAGEARLAAALSDGVDPFAMEPGVGFGWVE